VKQVRRGRKKASKVSGVSDLVRVNLWSSPRCASTSLMYSFAQRSDTQVVDEPLYAHYLRNIRPDAFRPYREEVLAAQINDGNEVVRRIVMGPLEGKRVLFLKHMAKHFAKIDEDFIFETKNVILIRHPVQVLASWSATLQEANTSYDDMGLSEQLLLVRRLQERNIKPIIISNDNLINRPEGTLRALCSALEIDFDPRMLSWPKGGRPEDGLWGRYWYHNTHASTSFHPVMKTHKHMDISQLSLKLKVEAERAIPEYDQLARLQLKPSPILPDERNRDILVHVGGVLKPREEAKVSVFDSSVQGGDAVWEGLRVYKSVILDFDEHIQRLQDSAHALLFEHVPEKEEIKRAVFETLQANGMRSDTHIRLTLTRGEKVTSGMSPKNNQADSCLIVLAEWKPFMDSSGKKVSGIRPQRLISSSIRRNSPAFLDSKIHHNNLLNNILAKIQANNADVDDALMLDSQGFVSETNATNFFIVRDQVVLTPRPDSCLPGITRGSVIKVARQLGMEVEERNISLAEVYTCDEAFTTGTMSGVLPVSEIDGRAIKTAVGPVTKRLQQEYMKHACSNGIKLPKF